MSEHIITTKPINKNGKTWDRYSVNDNIPEIDGKPFSVRD